MLCSMICAPSIRPGLSMHECGAAGSASGGIACPVRPILLQSLGPAAATGVLSSPAALSPPLLPFGMNVSFFISLVVGLPCRLIFCQFWLCEEAQCVYLCLHLGFLFYII